MSVYKEIIRAHEHINKLSGRIYPDACDYGIKINSLNASILKEVKNLKAIWGDDPEILKEETIRYDGGFTRKLIFSIYDEWESGRPMTVIFTYTTATKRDRFIGILSSDITGPKKTQWVDPAGGVHPIRDDYDPASLYE